VVFDIYTDGADEGVGGGRVHQFLQDARLAHPRVAHHNQLVAGVNSTAGAPATVWPAVTRLASATVATAEYGAAETHGFWPLNHRPVV